jgi:hypothetical protein
MITTNLLSSFTVFFFFEKAKISFINGSKMKAKTNTPEFNHAYYEKNKERLKAWKHEYYLTHKADYVRRAKQSAKRKANARKLQKMSQANTENMQESLRVMRGKSQRRPRNRTEINGQPSVSTGQHGTPLPLPSRSSASVEASDDAATLSSARPFSQDVLSTGE